MPASCTTVDAVGSLPCTQESRQPSARNLRRPVHASVASGPAAPACVDVLKRVAVPACHAALVANPQVDGLWQASCRARGPGGGLMLRQQSWREPATAEGMGKPAGCNGLRRPGTHAGRRARAVRPRADSPVRWHGRRFHTRKRRARPVCASPAAPACRDDSTPGRGCVLGTAGAGRHTAGGGEAPTKSLRGPGQQQVHVAQKLRHLCRQAAVLVLRDGG